MKRLDRLSGKEEAEAVETVLRMRDGLPVDAQRVRELLDQAVQSVLYYRTSMNELFFKLEQYWKGKNFP